MEQKARFLKHAISWLDDQECVARYAYFGTADVDLELLDHGGPALSALGTIYAFTPSKGTNTSQDHTSPKLVADLTVPVLYAVTTDGRGDQ